MTSIFYLRAWEGYATIFWLSLILGMHGQGQVVPANAVLSNPTDPAIARGALVLERISGQYAGVAKTKDETLSAGERGFRVHGGVGTTASLELDLPEAVWRHLPENDKEAVAQYVKSEIPNLKRNSDAYTHTPLDSVVYLAEAQNIELMRDNAWVICVGHYNANHQMLYDKTVAKGNDYTDLSEDAPSYIYANSSEDCVYNSDFDSSVKQVTDYFNKNENDPGTITYLRWSRVIKTGIGFKVTSDWGRIQGFGDGSTHETIFDLDHSGVIVKINGKALR